MTVSTWITGVRRCFSNGSDEIGRFSQASIVNRPWHIREARLEDADSLRECMEVAYATYQTRMDGRRLPPMDLDYASEISDYPTWIVELGNTLIGGITMTFEPEHASIANIAVHPEHQGRGVGSGLMTFAEDRARSRNYMEIHLATHVLLTENIALYRHLGWVENDRDETRVYMKKDVVRR